MVNMRTGYFIIVLSAVASAQARTMSSPHVEVAGNSLEDNRNKQNSESSTSSLLADIRFLYRLYEECNDSDLSTCLKMKLVIAMDRAAKSLNTLKIFEGVSFVRDPSYPIDTTKSVLENELEADLPRSLQDREDTLDKLIVDKLYQFFKTHSLQFKLLAIDDIKRSLSTEAEGGRAKRKGMHSLMLLSMLLGGTLLPLKFGALALLAGKALIISKLALALAAIIGLKKLVGGGGGGHETSYQVVTVPSHGHGGGHYKRSVVDGADLAYRAFAPVTPS